MTSAAATPRTSFKIVVGLDFTEAGDFAFRQAAQMAQGIAGCELHLIHVDEKEPASEEQRLSMAQRLRAYANDEAKASGGLPGVTLGIHLRSGKPVREVVQLATELSAGLIVLGTHKGPSLKSLFVGSTAESILAAAPCAVLISGPRPAPVAHEPTIEPACPECIRTRADSHGETWWCPQHVGHARQTHAFSYQREIPFATLDASVIPTGIKF